MPSWSFPRLASAAVLLLDPSAVAGVVVTPATVRPVVPAARGGAVFCQTTSSPSLSIPTPVDLLQRLGSKEARELQRELLELAIEQDPKVVFQRSLDLARALRTVGTETINGVTTGDVAEPAVLLRRMCEELGATYVKLGQFIASSPTLFPPDYVQEFQKCDPIHLRNQHTHGMACQLLHSHMFSHAPHSHTFHSLTRHSQVPRLDAAHAME